MSRRERLAWIGLVVFAAVLRLAALGVRPPHHDEAVHAHFVDVMLSGGGYHYDPTYHGPLLFYVTALVFAILGEGLTTLRLYPALAGIALVALPLLLRRRLGPRAAWWTGLVLALSPSFLYYSRFARNDVPVSLFTAAALVFLLRAVDGSWRWLPWVGVAAALHLAAKETFYVNVPLIAVGAAAVAVRGGVGRSVRAAAAWLRERMAPAATAVAWFFIIVLVAYTFFLVHPGDALFPYKAVSYWHGQHTVQRVGGPWAYHLPRLALYEFLIVGTALLRVARRWRRLQALEVFCATWGLAALVMYAYLGEKVPWLEVHQLLPFVPLAGLELGRVFSPEGRRTARALAGVALAATAWSSVAVAYLYPTITTTDRHAELLVFVQTTPEAGALAEHGREVAAAAPTDHPVIAVAGEASWPLSWQWRGLPVWWRLPDPGMRPDLVVCDPGDVARVRANLGAGYDARTIPLRGWWVEEWSGVTPLDVARWFVTRVAWSPLGATDVTVLERRGGGEP